MKKAQTVAAETVVSLWRVSKGANSPEFEKKENHGGQR